VTWFVPRTVEHERSELEEVKMLKDLSYGIPEWLADALGADPEQTLNGWPGFDHVRTYKSRVVVSQPYEASGEMIGILAKLNDKGIHMKFSGVSPYSPGRTFSLVLWRSEDDQLAREIVEIMAGQMPWKAAHPHWT
jgi:hypothetical protein